MRCSNLDGSWRKRTHRLGQSPSSWLTVSSFQLRTGRAWKTRNMAWALPQGESEVYVGRSTARHKDFVFCDLLSCWTIERTERIERRTTITTTTTETETGTSRSKTARATWPSPTKKGSNVRLFTMLQAPVIKYMRRQLSCYPKRRFRSRCRSQASPTT